jgi:simple sugar transport system ATP-binding protein
MTNCLLEAKNLVKTYGNVCALDSASFSVYEGEVVALIGDNGAGKSTLVKILSGVIQADSGEILIEGKKAEFGSPVAAREAGIETVYQDLALAPDLDAAANLFLGREPLHSGILGKLGVIDKARMRTEAASAFAKLGIGLQDPRSSVSSLSGGQRQAVAVSRSVVWASKIILMDEPTAALGVVQRRHVLDLVQRVRDTGVSVVVISHNMPEVLEVADRVEVLRRGKRVARFVAKDASIEDLVGAMTGSVEHLEPS